MFQKILVPLDGSEPSSKALEYSINVAKNFGSEIILLHIYSRAVPFVAPETGALPTPSIASAEITAEVIEAAKRIGNKILAEAKQAVEKKKIPVKAVLKEGGAVHEIVRTAKEEKIDLIVMGARGVSRIKELLLGSVSHGVCRKTTCSVMIVK